MRARLQSNNSVRAGVEIRHLIRDLRLSAHAFLTHELRETVVSNSM